MYQDMVLMKNKLLPQHVLTKSMRTTHIKHLYKFLSYIPRMYIVKLDADDIFIGMNILILQYFDFADMKCNSRCCLLSVVSCNHTVREMSVCLFLLATCVLHLE